MYTRYLVILPPLLSSIDPHGRYKIVIVPVTVPGCTQYALCTTRMNQRPQQHSRFESMRDTSGVTQQERDSQSQIAAKSQRVSLQRKSIRAVMNPKHPLKLAVGGDLLGEFRTDIAKLLSRFILTTNKRCLSYQTLS